MESGASIQDQPGSPQEGAIQQLFSLLFIVPHCLPLPFASSLELAIPIGGETMGYAVSGFGAKTFLANFLLNYNIHTKKQTHHRCSVQ